MKRVAARVVPLLLTSLSLGACAESIDPDVPPTGTRRPSPSAPAPAAPDLTDELIAKHPVGGVRWADEGELVTFPDGSTGRLSRSGDVPVLTILASGAEIVGEVPDHAAEGGLGPVPLELDSGGVGYVVMQGGGEFSAINLMVEHGGTLVSAGQACFVLEANAYERC